MCKVTVNHIKLSYLLVLYLSVFNINAQSISKNKLFKTNSISSSYKGYKNPAFKNIRDCYNTTKSGSKQKINNLFVADYLPSSSPVIYCLLNHKGQIILDSIEGGVNFIDNHSFIYKNNKIGIVNSNGEFVIPFVYQSADITNSFIIDNCIVS